MVTVEQRNTGRKPFNVIMSLFGRWDRRLFLDDDAAALVRGWEVRRLPAGGGREYRDRRWDLIAGCAPCAGNGLVGAHPCGECAGTGTVRLAPVPHAPVWAGPGSAGPRIADFGIADLTAAAEQTGARPERAGTS